jgi:hypothetical protein
MFACQNMQFGEYNLATTGIFKYDILFLFWHAPSPDFFFPGAEEALHTNASLAPRPVPFQLHELSCH